MTIDILSVLGNHDYYLVDSEAKHTFNNSFQRVTNLRELINKEKNMYCLVSYH